MSKDVALAPEKGDKEIATIRPTKADLFVDAFIRHRFNATQAALEVFDLSGDDEQRKRTAGSIGHEYLMKPETQKKLAARMARADISVEYVISKLKSKLEATDNDDVFMRALDRLAHFVGAEIKERSTDVSRGRNAHLSLYMGLPKEAREPQKVIDADIVG